MEEENRYAIAQVVMHGREQLVLLRSMDRLVIMRMLKHEAEVTKPQAFEDQAPEVLLSGEELDLTKRVIELSTPKRFDLSAYKDVYTEKLTKLIEAKVLRGPGPSLPASVRASPERVSEPPACVTPGRQGVRAARRRGDRLLR
jgi:non-homologous end joining protein Ku